MNGKGSRGITAQVRETLSIIAEKEKAADSTGTGQKKIAGGPRAHPRPQELFTAPSQKLHWKITTGQEAPAQPAPQHSAGRAPALALAPRPVCGQRTLWPAVDWIGLKGSREPPPATEILKPLILSKPCLTQVFSSVKKVGKLCPLTSSCLFPLRNTSWCEVVLFISLLLSYWSLHPKCTAHRGRALLSRSQPRELCPAQNALKESLLSKERVSDMRERARESS